LIVTLPVTVKLGNIVPAETETVPALEVIEFKVPSAFALDKITSLEVIFNPPE
jgi:hypothetical protein